MSGHISKIDLPKSEEEEQFESWSKLITPNNTIPHDYKGEVQIDRSALDGLIFLDVSKAECERRSKNRKIDPTTGTIYHMEDNPPPEGDQKLLDRLQDYVDEEADPVKMNNNHIQYEENEQQLKKWANSFGLSDAEKRIPDVISLKMNVEVEPKQTKKDSIEKVISQVSHVIDFKQSLYDI